MNDLQWYDIIRLITSVLSLAAMWRLGSMWRRRTHNEFERRKPDERLGDFFWLISASLFTLLVGSIENVTGNSPYRSVIFLGLAISIVAIRATRRRKNPISF